MSPRRRKRLDPSGDRGVSAASGIAPRVLADEALGTEQIVGGDRVLDRAIDVVDSFEPLARPDVEVTDPIAVAPIRVGLEHVAQQSVHSVRRTSAVERQHEQLLVGQPIEHFATVLAREHVVAHRPGQPIEARYVEEEVDVVG